MCNKNLVTMTTPQCNFAYQGRNTTGSSHSSPGCGSTHFMLCGRSDNHVLTICKAFFAENLQRVFFGNHDIFGGKWTLGKENISSFPLEENAHLCLHGCFLPSTTRVYGCSDAPVIICRMAKLLGADFV